MHIYTLVQLLGLGILWGVKETPAALVFPFFVILMVPLRLSLNYIRIYTPAELEAVSNRFYIIYYSCRQSRDYIFKVLT